MFTVEQRDALRERLLRLADEDGRVVAGAAVGSLAVDGGDRFSDLDLTFGITDDVPVGDVLDDWTRTLIDDLDAVHLADLASGPTTYRVFLLPDALQFDLSMTPAAHFRPAGPRFRLLFGETAADAAEAPENSFQNDASSPGCDGRREARTQGARMCRHMQATEDAASRRAARSGGTRLHSEMGSEPPVAGGLFISTPAVAGDLFGWGVIYALHARACIERGRVWQAEHYVGAVRDHALSLACLREERTAVQARGYDDLSADTLARFEGTHVGAVEPDALRRALVASVLALMSEGAKARLPHADTVEQRLAELR